MGPLLLLVLGIVLIALGLAGLVFPIVPGAPLMFVGMVLAAWADDFQYIGMFTLSVLAALALLTYVIDVVSGMLGARHFGASPRSMTGAGIGALVGLFFGLPGVVLGPFIGACIGELTSRPNLRAAGYAGVGATVGLALGAAAKIAVAFTMLGIFVVMRFA